MAFELSGIDGLLVANRGKPQLRAAGACFGVA
jgi:hypothetical protein